MVGYSQAMDSPLGIGGRVPARQATRSARVSGTEHTERREKGGRVRDPRIDQIQEHLYNGLAMMDLVGHTEVLHALWRRDSVAYAMQLAFHEWKTADALLSDVAEERHGACGGGLHVPRPRPPGPEGPAEAPPNGRPPP
jgi:hypothetical protein